MRTMGVEEELLLIDRSTGVPVPVADGVLAGAMATRVPDRGGVVGEMQREMIEVITRPHSSLAALGGQVLDNRALVEQVANGFGAHAAPLAASPTTVTPHVSDGARYRRMMQRYGTIPRHSLTCGLHVHVSIDSPAEGVAVLDRIRTWTPILIALSANSPFHAGNDTGHASFRSIAWNQWPSAGPMERFGSEERYRTVTESMLRTGALLDEGMLYLDARLSRSHPTVEVRVADVPLDPGVTVTIAGIVRALVDTAAEEWRSGSLERDTPACTVRLANWRAALEGLEGELVDPLTGHAAPAREVVTLLLAHVLPALTANGDDQLVERGLADLFARGTGAARQRAAYAATADLGQVALAAAMTNMRARTGRVAPGQRPGTASEWGAGAAPVGTGSAGHGVTGTER
ncbi:carboxylate-amine ligase [Curtobacterium sp. VKM Ac-1376]|uniref:carboxylate-amine ligase n=1 Tax=Curtobacterium sp. VKM Ac-1376 TaxID=123312 RepID=UPI00188D620C|nr:glutamate--cysteine ligase [Curtobacterium sp. VKM Ac-1376]MBF4615434.1 glutamate--cysteine ligase [Curtobacterium sp. VKM Ac-1376]